MSHQPMRGDALTALVEQVKRDAQAHLQEAALARLHGSDDHLHRTLAQVHDWFAGELTAAINVQLDTDIAYDWDVFEAGRQHGIAHGSAPAPLPTPCLWIEDNDGVWNTSCGVTWQFIDGNPSENRTNYCHHCGHPVKAQSYVEVLDAEEASQP